MAFAESWIETDPDGAAITVSMLDNAIRSAKIAVRERLEGDPANLLSGVIETGTFDDSSIPKEGAGRFHCDEIADIGQYPLQDGRGYFSADAGTSHPKVYSLQGSGAREIAYLNRDGSRNLLGTLVIDIDQAVTDPDVFGLYVDIASNAAAITLTEVFCISVRSVFKGAGSTINTVYGIKVENQTVGSTVNYALYCGSGRVHFGSNANDAHFLLDDAGDLKLGNNTQSTGSTAGFVHIQKVAGAPTGTPGTYTGHVPIVYDSTNNRLYIWNSAWKNVQLA